MSGPCQPAGAHSDGESKLVVFSEKVQSMRLRFVGFHLSGPCRPTSYVLFFPIHKLRMRFVGFHLLLVATVLLNLLGLQFLSKGSNMPKWAFIAWLACSKRLASRMGSEVGVWVCVPLVFYICQQSDESHDHLFFDCAFSHLVWADIYPSPIKIDSKESWGLGS